MQIKAWGFERYALELHAPGPERLPSFGKGCIIPVQTKLELMTQMDQRPIESGAISLFLVGNERAELRLKALHNHMHLERSKERAQGCKHFALAIDPPTYSGESTCVSVLWCWEEAVVVIPPIKVPWGGGGNSHLCL